MKVLAAELKARSATQSMGQVLAAPVATVDICWRDAEGCNRSCRDSGHLAAPRGVLITSVGYATLKLSQGRLQPWCSDDRYVIVTERSRSNRCEAALERI